MWLLNVANKNARHSVIFRFQITFSLLLEARPRQFGGYTYIGKIIYLSEIKMEPESL